jgi:hypothetical protein
VIQSARLGIVLTGIFHSDALNALCELVSAFCEPAFLCAENGGVATSGTRADAICAKDKVRDAFTLCSGCWACAKGGRRANKKRGSLAEERVKTRARM